MDGRGRRLDNVFVERLWRSVKYDDIYLQKYARVPKLEKGLEHYFAFYNYERPHQELTYQVPAEVYLGSFDSLLFTQEVSPIWVGLWS